MTQPAAAPAEPSPRAAERAAMLAFSASVQMRSLRALDAELQALEAEPRDESRVEKLQIIAGSVDKAARALRMTLAMEERSEIDREVRIRQALAAAEKKAAERAEDLRQRKRKHLGFALERAIETAEDAYASSKTKDRLERVERLVDRESIERETFLDRPMSVILSRLCVELGVKVRPGVWRGADWIKEDGASPETPAVDRPTATAGPVPPPTREAPPPLRSPTPVSHAPP